MHSLVVVMGSFLMTGAALAQFPDAHDAAPPGWGGSVFRLSQAYPKSMPAWMTDALYKYERNARNG